MTEKKPKQKREIREQLEKQKAEGKKARLLENLLTETHKTPRQQQNPDSIMQMKMEWCCEQADTEGVWSWHQERQWTEQDWDNIIKPNLEIFSTLTWAEILRQTTGTKKKRHKKHHDMAICVIRPEAQARWQQIELVQYEDIFRFRLGGKPRLWGFRIRHKFWLFWWDPDHLIYPTEK